MLDQLWEYAILLYKEVPASVYYGLIILLCIGSVVILFKWGVRKGWRKVGLFLLVEYVFLLFGSTILFRESTDSIAGHNYLPFWSYEAILDGRCDLVAEIIMNTLVFVPVGLLICTQIAHRSQKGWLVAMMMGAGISVSIEILQFVMARGFAELDDVMHNTLGCLMGFGLYRLIRSICFKF